MIQIEKAEIMNTDLDESGPDALKRITIRVNVTAPIYWWYELNVPFSDNSVMASIVKEKEFTISDFSAEHLISDWNGDNCEAIIYPNSIEPCSPMNVLQTTIAALNANREAYLNYKKKIFVANNTVTACFL